MAALAQTVVRQAAVVLAVVSESVMGSAWLMYSKVVEMDSVLLMPLMVAESVDVDKVLWVLETVCVGHV